MVRGDVTATAADGGAGVHVRALLPAAAARGAGIRGRGHDVGGLHGAADGGVRGHGRRDDRGR